MKLYVVRHGLTDWNIQNKIQGLTDIPLNAAGVKQVTKLREKIRDMQFDICFASPLRRTMQTAQIITRGQCQIIPDSRIIERSFGDFEGVVLTRGWGRWLEWILVMWHWRLCLVILNL